MRWRTPKMGDKKIVTKFAFFPIRIDDEVRWLEKVAIEMEYGITMWIPTKFIDDDGGNNVIIQN